MPDRRPGLPASREMPPPRGVRRIENGRGLMLMVAGMFLFSAVDAQAKFLTDSLHPLQIVWSRQLGLLLGVLVLLVARGRGLLETRRPGLQIARGLLAAGSAVCFVVAVKYVPLADAIAVTFVAPFMVTAMGALLLGEPVGARRWTAVAVGFLGAMIVIRPGFGAMHPAGLLAIAAATMFALRQILSRVLGGSERTATTVAYTALAGGAALTLPLPFVWQWPVPGIEVALLVSIAVMAGLAEILVIKALELALAAVVAPMQYTILIWGTFYGWAVFGQLPDAWTWAGAFVIVATGLYTLRREARRSGSA